MSRLLAPLVVPILLWGMLWIGAGFPVAGPELMNVVSVWAVLYIPAKVAKLLIHRETGFANSSSLIVGAIATAFAVIWLAFVATIIISQGFLGLLLVIPAGVLFAYILFLIWCDIRGEEEATGRVAEVNAWTKNDTHTKQGIGTKSKNPELPHSDYAATMERLMQETDQKQMDRLYPKPPRSSYELEMEKLQREADQRVWDGKARKDSQELAGRTVAYAEKQASELPAFLDGSGPRPYRDLVQYHMKRQSSELLRENAMGEIAMLPKDLQPGVEHYLDVIFHEIGRDKSFWQTATCQAAFDLIIRLAIEVFPLSERIGSPEDALKPANHHLAFGLFQITTVNFAFSASTVPANRKFMGIRKGLFG